MWRKPDRQGGRLSFSNALPHGRASAMMACRTVRRLLNLVGEQLLDGKLEGGKNRRLDLLAASEDSPLVEAAARLAAHLDGLCRLVNQPQLAHAERAVGVGLRVAVVDGRAGRDDFDDEVGRVAVGAVEPSLKFSRDVKQVGL